MTATNNRKADYPIDAMFLERWSPRAFTNEEIEEIWRLVPNGTPIEIRP